MRKGRQADSARRRRRVISAPGRAVASGSEISVSGIAGAAGAQIEASQQVRRGPVGATSVTAG